MFGGRAGLGMTPAAGMGVPGQELGVMDLDPVEVLGPEELELPTTEQGLEARLWTEALRVSNFWPVSQLSTLSKH